VRAAVETYYEILNISPDAAPDEIRAAYRNLAKQYHPYVNPDPGASERFIAIQQAYETLIDPDARARYDLALRGGASFAPHDPFRSQAAGENGQTAWAPGFSWRGEVPVSGIGRLGLALLLFFGGILIALMLALSLLFRVAAGGKRQ